MIDSMVRPNMDRKMRYQYVAKNSDRCLRFAYQPGFQNKLLDKREQIMSAQMKNKFFHHLER